MVSIWHPIVASISGPIFAPPEPAATSASQLAARVGVGQSVISLCEAGRVAPNVERIHAIAAALDIDPGLLFAPADFPRPRRRWRGAA